MQFASLCASRLGTADSRFMFFSKPRYLIKLNSLRPSLVWLEQEEKEEAEEEKESLEARFPICVFLKPRHLIKVSSFRRRRLHSGGEEQLWRQEHCC